MSFFSKLFCKADKKQHVPDTDTSDDEGPLSAPVLSPTRHTRTGIEGGDACGDSLQSRRRGGDLRRSRTCDAGQRPVVEASPSASDGPERLLEQQYRIGQQRHVGRNAVILEAVERASQHPVIIKAFTKAGMGMVKRDKVEQELAVLHAVRGVPGVVRPASRNLVEDASHVYTVLEVAPGKSLLELMSNTMEGRLPEAWCVDHLVVPLFTTLAALHATGVAHRDIKPEHIMVDKGATCLLDFHESVQMGNQCLNHRVGQLEYMAPEMADAPSFEDLFHLVLEQGVGEDELPQYTEKVDIWSAGAVVFEAMMGQQVLAAESLPHLQNLQLSGFAVVSPEGIPARLQQCKGLSGEAVSFLSHALSFSPNKRWTAQALLHHPWVTHHAVSAKASGMPPSTLGNGRLHQNQKSHNPSAQQ